MTKKRSSSDATHFAYDAAGNLTSSSDAHAYSTYEYDELGRLQTDDQTIVGLWDSVAEEYGTHTVTYTSDYNELNLRTLLSAVVDGEDDFQNAYGYDNLQRLTSVTQAGNISGNAVAEKRADLHYDASGAFRRSPVCGSGG